MIKYLLDTNIIIYLIKGAEPLTSNIQKYSPNEIAVSGFTEAELRFGIENSKDENKLKNESATNLILSLFTRLYHDERVSDRYGSTKAHMIKNKIYVPKLEIDLFIAATALAYDLTLITNNKKDFSNIPNLSIDDWSI